MSLKLFAFIIFSFLMQAVAASAQVCTFSNTGVDFGNVNMIIAQPTSTGTFSASCTGTPGQQILICANFNAGSGGMHPSGDPRYLTQGASRLEYNLYTNKGKGKIWGSYLWAPPDRPPSITFKLDKSGNGSVSQTIFGIIFGGQNATPTGTFISTFSGSQSQIDYGYSSSFNCSSTLSTRVQIVPFTVRTTNNSTCNVSTTNLDFGTQTDLSTAKLATNSIYITCTPGTAYTIGMSNGTSGATSPALRKMTNATTTDFVGYGIYLDAARTQVWGNGVTGAMPSTTGNGLAQSFTGYGLVPAQATPTPLDYTDTVIVTITY
jgi:spore coat protein U-like protein